VSAAISPELAEASMSEFVSGQPLTLSVFLFGFSRSHGQQSHGDGQPLVQQFAASGSDTASQGAAAHPASHGMQASASQNPRCRWANLVGDGPGFLKREQTSRHRSKR
jgi:hypothetical protein